MLFLAVVILCLDTDDDGDGTIDSDTVVPTVGGINNGLNDDVDRSQPQQELQGAVRERLLDELEQGSNLGDTLHVCAETIAYY